MLLCMCWQSCRGTSGAWCNTAKSLSTNFFNSFTRWGTSAARAWTRWSTRENLPLILRQVPLSSIRVPSEFHQSSIRVPSFSISLNFQVVPLELFLTRRTNSVWSDMGVCEHTMLVGTRLSSSACRISKVESFSEVCSGLPLGSLKKKSQHEELFSTDS